MTRVQRDDGNWGPGEPSCTCHVRSESPCRYCDGSDDLDPEDLIVWAMKPTAKVARPPYEDTDSDIPF